MKKILIFIVFLTGFCVQAQECSKQSVLDWQAEINASFADGKTTPLNRKDLKKFESLDFYPVDLQYCVVARFVQTPNEKPFEMATTTARKAMYVKYGEAYFDLNGKACKLDVFQNLELAEKEGYEDHLFLPFTDLTNGEESYGGGRYIGVTIPTADNIVIDFNKAYNPYCAYNHKYSCPIPPSQNFIEVEVKAGVKAFKH